MAENENVRYHFEYDELNRLSRKITHAVAEDENFVISYTYNQNGQVSSMTDPNGGVTTYKYDLLNRLVRMQNPAGEVTMWTYDAMGRRLQMIFSNGLRRLMPMMMRTGSRRW